MRGKGEGSIFKDSRGYWTGRIELPSPDGTRRQKKIRRKVKADLLKEMQVAREELRVRGDLPTADQTVEQWFRYWLRQKAREARPNTVSNYTTVVEKYIIPTIGKTRIEKVTAATVRKVTAHMTDELGLSSTYALNAHRIMSTAFETALREGRIGRNPAKLTSAPKKARVKLDVLSPVEAVRVLEHVSGIPNGARWATALLTGARRGEAIGIELDRVGDVLDLSWQLQRLIWRHGCGDTCRGKRGADCPDRRIIVPADYEHRHLVDGLYLTRPKSSAGWRIIPLVDPLRAIFEAHIAHSEPNPWGLLFTHQDRPIDPDQDTRRWKTVLGAVGLDKDPRLHDLRHTAANLLLAAGVPPYVVTQILGHSSWASTQAYVDPQNLTMLRAGMMSMAATLITDDGRALTA